MVMGWPDARSSHSTVCSGKPIPRWRWQARPISADQILPAPDYYFLAKHPPNAPKHSPAKVTNHRRSDATPAALPARGREGICGLAAPPASLPAQPAPKPSPEPSIESALFLPLSVPKGHLKPPPSRAEPLLVLHLARTPAPDTCAGGELLDLAGMGEAASLWLSPSLLQRKHLILPDSAGKKGEGCSETAREVVDLMSRGDCLGEKRGDVTVQGKSFRVGVSVPKGRRHLLARAAQRGL